MSSKKFLVFRLSDDIVRAIGGEIKVDTKEGIGSSFIIMLPIISG
jgi:signal transduction histidine kinase